MYKKYLVFVLMLTYLLAGCNTTNTPIVLPEGEKAAALGKAKDEQIAGLVAQVKAEQSARELEQKRASLAAANLEGILFAAEHVDKGLPRDAIEAEARLGKERSPTPDPQEVIKSKDRVIAILENEIEKANKLYEDANSEAKKANEQIIAKDKEIENRSKELKETEAAISVLERQKIEEQKKHENDVNNLIKDHKAEIQKLLDEQAAKEKHWWVNATRVVGLGFIVIGAILILAFKIVPEGIGSIIVGILIGLAAIGVDILTSQWWFPYACIVVGLLILGGGGFALYRLWKKHKLHDMNTQAIQDMIDEATIKGDTKAVEELKAHLTYRMGDKNSFWGKAQTKEIIKLGLINPKAEESLKSLESPKT